MISFSSLGYLNHWSVRAVSRSLPKRLYSHQRSRFLLIIRSHSSFTILSWGYNSVEFSTIAVCLSISGILDKDDICRCGSSYRLQENTNMNSVRVSRFLFCRLCFARENLALSGSIFWQWANRAHSKFDGKSIRERIYLTVHLVHTYSFSDRQRIRGFHFPGRWKDLERGAASPALW